MRVMLAPLPRSQAQRVAQMRPTSRRARRTLRRELRRWWVIRLIPWWSNQLVPWWDRNTDPQLWIPGIGLLGILGMLPILVTWRLHAC